MKITSRDVSSFLDNLESSRKKDIEKLIALGKKITNKAPALWGSIIGFDNVHYTYKTGHSGDMPVFSFASRSQAITLYLRYNISAYSEIEQLGKYKLGKGCLYIKKLSDINWNVLEKLVKKTINDTYHLKFITKNKEDSS